MNAPIARPIKHSLLGYSTTNVSKAELKDVSLSVEDKIRNRWKLLQILDSIYPSKFLEPSAEFKPIANLRS